MGSPVGPYQTGILATPRRRELHNRSTSAMPLTLKVNGKSTTVDVPPDMPLLWVLRDVLNLKGTKFGCGVSQCGSCTVHVNGQATRSCITKVADVAGAEITTIEGLSAKGTHP